MSDYTAWYEAHRHELTGGGLWLKGGEINAPSSFVGEGILVVRLSTYRDTALSTTHRVLARIADTIAGTWGDTAFLPPPRDGRIMKRGGVPWLVGTGSRRGPDGFALIAVSNAITQELVNLPAMLRASGIPLEPERRSRSGFPPVILGGANAANTAALWHEESPVDGIFIGDDFELIRRLFSIAVEGRRQGDDRRDILSAMRSVDGFFLPHERRPVRPSRRMRPVESFAVGPLAVPYDEESAGGGTVTISAGCPHFCSFCAESWQRKPYREVPADAVIAAALKEKAASGLDSIDLYSFNFNIHSEIGRIITELSRHFRSVGLKSQRFDMIARNPSMAGFLEEAGKGAITCGLEGISARMRRYLAKSLSEDDLRESLRLIAAGTFRELKIFIIACGFETKDDIAEFAALLKPLAGSMKGRRIVVSCTPLVRFPHTPLAAEPAPEADTVAAVTKRIAAAVREVGVEFRLAADMWEYFVSQILLRGDRTVWEALAKTAARQGFLYYGSFDQNFADAFRREMKDAGIDLRSLLQTWHPDEQYGFIDCGVDKKFMQRAAADAANFRDAKCCLGAECRGCGACGDDDRAVILAPRDTVFDREALAAIRRNAQRFEREILVRYEGDISDGKRYTGARIARAIMTAMPSTVSAYRGFRFLRSEDAGTGYALVFREDGMPTRDDLTASAERISELLGGAKLTVCG